MIAYVWIMDVTNPIRESKKIRQRKEKVTGGGRCDLVRSQKNIKKKKKEEKLNLLNTGRKMVWMCMEREEDREKKTCSRWRKVGERWGSRGHWNIQQGYICSSRRTWLLCLLPDCQLESKSPLTSPKKAVNPRTPYYTTSLFSPFPPMIHSHETLFSFCGSETSVVSHCIGMEGWWLLIFFCIMVFVFCFF